VIAVTISLRLNDEDSALIRKYAEMKKMTVSELIRQTVLEQIENEFDLQLYEKAMKEYLVNPITYSLDEMEKELGLK
jgi:RHH-type rel operon transcriptional repressor/antitoxin RelB